jgi:hypothetical protein
MNIDNNFLEAIYYNFFEYLKSSNLPYVTVRTLPVESQIRNPNDLSLFDITISNYNYFDNTTRVFIVDRYGNYLETTIITVMGVNEFKITSPYFQDHDFDILIINKSISEQPQETEILTVKFENGTIVSKDPYFQFDFDYNSGKKIISARIYDDKQSFNCQFSSFLNKLSLFWQGAPFSQKFTVELTVSKTIPFITTSKKLFLLGKDKEIRDGDHALITISFTSAIYITEIAVIDNLGHRQVCTFDFIDSNLNIRFPNFINDLHFFVEITLGDI